MRESLHVSSDKCWHVFSCLPIGNVKVTTLKSERNQSCLIHFAPSPDSISTTDVRNKSQHGRFDPHRKSVSTYLPILSLCIVNLYYARADTWADLILCSPRGKESVICISRQLNYTRPVKIRWSKNVQTGDTYGRLANIHSIRNLKNGRRRFDEAIKKSVPWDHSNNGETNYLTYKSRAIPLMTWS